MFIIYEQYPAAQTGKVLRVVLRKFPENRNRYIVILREETTKSRYILLEDENGNKKIQEVDVIRRNLQRMNDQIKKETEVREKIELIVDEAESKKSVEVDEV